MQRAFDVILNGPAPANRDNTSDGDACEALVRRMARLSDEQIARLEDEIDFFAFTGLVGDLMGEVLGSAAATSARAAAVRPARRFAADTNEGWRRAG